MNSRCHRFAKAVKTNVSAILLGTLLAGCYGNAQDTPESVVDTFAQSMASMDIESAVSCFEYGDEILSLMGGMSSSGCCLNNDPFTYGKAASFGSR